MRKFIILLVAFFLGVKFGGQYLMSSDFQEYANRTKAPWTCKFENYVGHFNMLLSDYSEAQVYFRHTVKRCPDTPLMEEAEFEIARCLEGRGANREATQAYMDFAEKYPGTKRARIAVRAADLIRVN